LIALFEAMVSVGAAALGLVLALAAHATALNVNVNTEYGPIVGFENSLGFTWVGKFI
jgi:hypothetical protein